MLGVLLMFGVMYWFVPLHGSGATWMNERVLQQRQAELIQHNNSAQSQRKILDNQRQILVPQSHNSGVDDDDGNTTSHSIDKDHSQDYATRLDLTRDALLTDIFNSGNEGLREISELTPDVIKQILADNQVNLIVIGVTIVLIGVLTWLLKKNTDMRNPIYQDIKQRAAESLAYATEMFNQARDLVYQAHQEPDNLQIEEQAVVVLQDTELAIDIASDLVAEYVEYLQQDQLMTA
jgi:hypothetical protein